ncbi:uncharacterized protein LOC143568743 [Bidens hawaiensis]|uniref:uncharacterized protein LOC143568743 n=1 Tax=Bidens hawaiensis TaxID=980011 RepID=UPI00404957E9
MSSDKPESVADKLKSFANGVLDNLGLSRQHRPIEIDILKRLQREAFADIMKLRDRQDKVERILSLKSSKPSPFSETSTRVRGEIEALGMVLMVDGINEDNQEAINRIGIKTGVNSRFTFETTVREEDSLTAEFVAKGQLDGSLSLAKVAYSANVNDWCSLVAVPLGAKCSDVGHSFTGPPLLNQHIGSGVGLTMKKSNRIASLAQFVNSHWVSTFGQVSYKLPWSTKVSLLGVKKTRKIPSQNTSLGQLTLPIGSLRRHQEPIEASDGSGGSASMVIESDIDSSTKVSGWVEMNSLDPRYLQWGVSMTDLPDDDIGWGFKVGGSNAWDHYQFEVFSKAKFGEKLSLEPSLMFVKDGSTQFPALVMKSNWSF